MAESRRPGSACSRPSSLSSPTGSTRGKASATEHILTADKITNKIPGSLMSNRSISISLDERLLTQRDALRNAYTDLARLKGGALDAGGDDAVMMALEFLTPGAVG